MAGSAATAPRVWVPACRRVAAFRRSRRACFLERRSIEQLLREVPDDAEHDRRDDRRVADAAPGMLRAAALRDRTLDDAELTVQHRRAEEPEQDQRGAHERRALRKLGAPHHVAEEAGE